MPAPVARHLLAVLFVLPCLGAGLPAPQEALGLAYPGAAFTRREHFLTDTQARRVKELAGTELPGLWIVSYEARFEGRMAGVAFFDTHRVRTLNGTAMVAVDTGGAVRRVEVVAFKEPAEYLPRGPWIRQLEGRPLDSELNLNRAIRPLSGATLTAHALVDASRRGLALYQVLYAGAK